MSKVGGAGGPSGGSGSRSETNRSDNDNNKTQNDSRSENDGRTAEAAPTRDTDAAGPTGSVNEANTPDGPGAPDAAAAERDREIERERASPETVTDARSRAVNDPGAAAMRASLDAELDRAQTPDGPGAPDPSAKAETDPATGDPAGAVAPATADPAGTVDPATVDPATVDPATVDPATVDPATADPAVPDAGPSAETLAEVDAFNTLAESDAAAAAERLAGIVDGVDPSHRGAVIDAAGPGLETVGERIGENPVAHGDTLGHLDQISDTLHADGQPEVAAAAADRVAAGLETSLSGQANWQNRQRFEATLSNTVKNGGANIAADLTSSFIDGHTGPGPNALANHSAAALRNGAELAREELRAVDTRLGEASDRLSTTEGLFGEHLSEADRQAGRDAVAESMAPDLERRGELAASVVEGAEASARAAEAVLEQARANNPGLSPAEAVNDFAVAETFRSTTGALEVNAGEIPRVATDPNVMARFGDTLAAQGRGETTVFDTVADLRASGALPQERADAIGRGLISGAVGGAALSGATALGGGAPSDGVLDTLTSNANALLPASEAATIGDAVQTVRDAHAGRAGLPELSAQFDAVKEITGPGAASLLGGLGAVGTNPVLGNGLPPNAGRIIAGAGTLAGAASLALNAEAALRDGSVSLSEAVKLGLGAGGTINDALGLVAQNGSQLARWTGVAGRVLTGTGGALGVIDSIRNGDAIGLASNSLLVAGALSGNPGIALAGAGLDLTRAGVNLAIDTRRQLDTHSTFLEGAGISPENVDFLGTVGPHGAAALLGPNGLDHSSIADLNDRIDAYRNGDLNPWSVVEGHHVAPPVMGP